MIVVKIADHNKSLLQMDRAELLARVAWGEARGQGQQAMRDVMCVVRTRVANPGWWGATWNEVMLASQQFSCLNEGDPNRAKLLAVKNDDAEFAAALTIAPRIIAGYLDDLTYGADSYFSTLGPAPYWSKTATHTVTRFTHSFWIVRFASADKAAPVINSTGIPK